MTQVVFINYHGIIAHLTCISTNDHPQNLVDPAVPWDHPLFDPLSSSLFVSLVTSRQGEEHPAASPLRIGAQKTPMPVLWNKKQWNPQEFWVKDMVKTHGISSFSRSISIDPSVCFYSARSFLDTRASCPTATPSGAPRTYHISDE